MKRKLVKFEIDIPVDATESEITEWVKFELGATAQMSAGNPLVMFSLEARPGSVEIDS